MKQMKLMKPMKPMKPIKQTKQMKQMKPVHKQRGLSGLGWIILLAVGGFLASIVIKLLPVYMDDMAITRVLNSLNQNEEIHTASTYKVRQLIEKGLDTNMVRDIKKEDIKVYREGGYLKVDMDYERRQHLFGNVDVVLMFHQEWQILRQ
jgi:hypothetical protein